MINSQGHKITSSVKEIHKYFDSFALIKSKCLPILFCGTETCPLNSANTHSLEFTINKVLYKIFGAMFKNSYGEICK